MIDWGLIASLWFLVAMSYPAHCCCCPCQEGVAFPSICLPGSTAPLYKVTITGITNGSCSECTTLNAVYFVEQVATGGGAACCQYTLTIPEVCGLIDGMTVQLGVLDTFWLTQGGSARVIYDLPTNTFPIDCLTESIIPPYSSSTHPTLCGWTTATITIEAP